MSLKFKMLFIVMAALGVFLTIQINDAFAGCSSYHRQARSLRNKINQTNDRHRRIQLRNQLKLTIERGRACDSQEARQRQQEERARRERLERERDERRRQNECRRKKAQFQRRVYEYNKCARSAWKLAQGKCGTPPQKNYWDNSCN